MRCPSLSRSGLPGDGGHRGRKARHRSWTEAVHPSRVAAEEEFAGCRLGEVARELLNGLAETASSDWVFPGDRGNGPSSTNALWVFWIKARDAAGIVADARLHDLRHSHASHALMNGESLHVAGRLPGHRRATTTNRYVHLDDATLGQAGERVAKAKERKLRVVQWPLRISVSPPINLLVWSRVRDRYDAAVREGCVTRKGATHFHWHLNGSEAARKIEERELIAEHPECQSRSGCNGQDP